YVPPQPPAGPTCTPPTGSGKLYAVSLFNSSALGVERGRVLHAGGIPPSPAFMAVDRSTNPATNTSNPLASSMTRWVVLAGTENPLTNAEQNLLNSNVDTFKAYWLGP
ncbi:MAG TPA: hypothetical protein VIM41_01335, partial [Gammaproteobacteria bacterium]